MFRCRCGNAQLVGGVAARYDGIPTGILVSLRGIGDHRDEELDELDERREIALHHPEEGEGEFDEVGIPGGILPADLLHEGLDDHLARAE